jgi:hypothetical protein
MLLMRLVNAMFSRQCPHCRSIEFRTVGARNAAESALLWILVPHRCALCGHHFFLLRWQVLIGGTA